ncbi:MAG: POTRA domain-containing protein [Polyangiales bacterium]
MGLLLGLAIGLGSPSAHAQLPEAFRGLPVRSVEVRGDGGLIDPSSLGVPEGTPVGRPMLRALVERLLSEERWADVQLDLVREGDGVRLEVALVPRLVLTRVDVYGNDVVETGDLLRELRVSSGGEIDGSTLETLAPRTAALYAERGYDRVHLDVELRNTDDPSRKVLLLRIDEGEPTRVRELRFAGDAPPVGSGLRRALGISTGDVLERATLDEHLREAEASLREEGWLAARLGPARIEPLDDGVRLVVPAVIGPRYEVQIRGQEPFSRSEVLEAIAPTEERLTRGMEGTLATRLVDWYRRRGFPRPRVRVTTEAVLAPDGRPFADRARLDVRIEAGDRLEVVARSYPGARHFRDDFLDDQIASYLQEIVDESSLFAPVDGHVADRLLGPRRGARDRPRPIDIDPKRIWYESAYERAVEHVRELYEAEGYLDARVGPTRLQEIGHERAVVVVPVVEGPRTMLFGLELEGQRALGARELAEATRLEAGQPFSYLALEQAKSRIEELYRDRGYFYATVASDVRFSGDRTRAEVVLHIEERYPVTVGEVVIRGNAITRESLIRRVMRVREGEPLTPAVMRTTQERLLDLGIFEGVNVAPQDEDLPARVKAVEITVAERKSQFLDFRAGVSTGQGLRFGAEYGYRNLFGTAISLSLAAQFGYQFLFLDDEVQRRFEALSLQDRLERRVNATLSFPYVGRPNLRLSLTIGHQRENERNFGLDRNSVDVTLGWRPKRVLQINWSNGFEGNDVQILGSESYQEVLEEVSDDIRLRNLLRIPEGRSTIVASTVTVSYDRRDNPFTPKRGFILSGTTEWARTLTTEAANDDGERFFSHHLRLIGSASGYVPMGDRDRFVFAMQLKLGRVVHLEPNSSTYPNRQFFLGGLDTVRGYLQDALIPQDIADAAKENPAILEGAVQGGDVFMVLRGELRFPIAGSLRGGLFVDLGNSWRDVGPGTLEPWNLRPTGGFGLRIATPVGPIALDYGILILRRDFLEEPFGSFHFSIGLF